MRESVLPDEQLETKLQPELQKFLDDLDASTETEESVASRPNYLTDSRTASEFTADFRIGAHLDRRFPVHVFDRALGRVTIVVIQHSTESLTTLDVSSNSGHFVARFNDLVLESLMVAFPVVMFEIGCDSATQ